MLAVGSFLFGLLFAGFILDKITLKEISCWIATKLFQRFPVEIR